METKNFKVVINGEKRENDYIYQIYRVKIQGEKTEKNFFFKNKSRLKN
jgi:hypothetical protein